MAHIMSMVTEGVFEKFPTLKVVLYEGGIFWLPHIMWRFNCPHQGARVCLGRIVGTALPSDVYQYTYGREEQILRCPWHEWEYDIATGTSLFDSNVKVVSYPIEVLGDDIVVTIGP